MAEGFTARLVELDKAATPGPWPDSWRDPTGKFLPARYKFVNSKQAEANGRLIAHLVNHREAILALVEAAEERCAEPEFYDYTHICAALEALDRG